MIDHPIDAEIRKKLKVALGQEMSNHLGLLAFAAVHSMVAFESQGAFLEEAIKGFKSLIDNDITVKSVRQISKKHEELCRQAIEEIGEETKERLKNLSHYMKITIGRKVFE